MVRNRWCRYTSIDHLLVIQNIDFLPNLHIRISSWHDSVFKSFVNIAYWIKSTGGKESVLSLCINELSSRNTKIVFFYRTYISEIVHGMTMWLMTVLFTVLILSGSRAIRFTELWCYQGPSRWHSTARNWVDLWHRISYINSTAKWVALSFHIIHIMGAYDTGICVCLHDTWDAGADCYNNIAVLFCSTVYMHSFGNACRLIGIKL